MELNSTAITIGTLLRSSPSVDALDPNQQLAPPMEKTKQQKDSHKLTVLVKASPAACSTADGHRACACMRVNEGAAREETTTVTIEGDWLE